MKTLTFLFLILLTSLTFAQNNALDFDGTDEYVSTNTSVNLSNDNITLEAWIYLESYQAVSPYISSIAGVETVDGTHQALLRIGNDGANYKAQFVLRINGAERNIFCTSIIKLNTWYHVAGIYDHDKLRIYINGIEEGITSSIVGTISASEFFFVGAVTDGSSGAMRFFDGKIDEVRVWTIARSVTQLRADMYREIAGNLSDLKIYYALNASSGTHIEDDTFISSDYDGTSTNMEDADWVTSSAFYGPKNCLDFDASSDYAGSNSPVMTSNDNFTMMAWFKADAIPSDEWRCIAYTGIDGEGYGIGTINGKAGGLFGGKAWHITDETVTTDKWYHIAMRRSSGTTQFFLNGKLLSYSSTITPNAQQHRFTIGNMFSADNSTLYTTSFDGQIDEVRVYDAALTDAQIRDHICKSLDGNEANLVAYYNFDNTAGTKLHSLDNYNGGGTGYDLTLTNMSDDDWVTSTAFNTWLNTDDATWSETTNWSRGTVPGATDNVGIQSYSGGTNVTISGTPTVNNLDVVSNTTLTVSSEFTVNDNLILNSNLDPNNNAITLSSTGTLIEGSGVFYGTSGYIGTNRDLNNITSENVGGLGAVITTSANMGNTTIIRAHDVQVNSSNNSVKRYYQITPTTNTGLDATIVFNYETDELNSLTEADLKLYKSIDSGSNWTLAGGTVSTANNTVTLSGLDGFSRWTLFDEVAPAPVELVSFTAHSDASASSATIVLNWETATEINNYGFEIERASLSATPVRTDWETLSFIEGHGNSNSPKDYSFVDSNPLGGSAQYRLKQMDADGTFEYSSVVEIDTPLPKVFKLVQNYPNPFNPTTVINYNLPRASDVQLIVYNMLGQEVVTLVNKKQNAGKFSVEFNASNLTSGIYFYSINAGDFVSVKKMLLLK